MNKHWDKKVTYDEHLQKSNSGKVHHGSLATLSNWNFQKAKYSNSEHYEKSFPI